MLAFHDSKTIFKYGSEDRLKHVLRSLIFVSLVAVTVFPSIASAERILVLDFELNDLTLYPNVEQELTRVAMLRPLLVDELEVRFDHVTPSLPASAAAEAAKGQGYVFDRPDVATRLGSEVDADWVVSGRLHKASHLFVYLKAQLIDVHSGQMVYDFVVELKGWGEKLTRKGTETLAIQIQDAIDEISAQGD